MPSYYIYILTNIGNKVLYTGMTSNLKQRISKHKSKHKGFTSKYNVNKLVYYETVAEKSIALKREKQIKNLIRRKKINMINNFNKTWVDKTDAIASLQHN